MPYRDAKDELVCPYHMYRSSTDIRLLRGSILVNLNTVPPLADARLSGPGCWACEFCCSDAERAPAAWWFSLLRRHGARIGFTFAQVSSLPASSYYCLYNVHAHAQTAARTLADTWPRAWRRTTPSSSRIISACELTFAQVPRLTGTASSTYCRYDVHAHAAVGGSQFGGYVAKGVAPHDSVFLKIYKCR